MMKTRRRKKQRFDENINTHTHRSEYLKSDRSSRNGWRWMMVMVMIGDRRVHPPIHQSMKRPMLSGMEESSFRSAGRPSSVDSSIQKSSSMSSSRVPWMCFRNTRDRRSTS